MASELVQAFLNALPERARFRLEACAELPAILRDAVTSARSAWPSIEVSELGFMVYVATRVDEDIEPASLAKLRINDLYLACGCMLGDPEALTQLEHGYVRRLVPVVARVSPGSADDVVAALRERLLLPSQPTQGLASYAGRSDLWTWLRISAVRSAVRAHRRSEQAAKRERGVVDALGVASAFGSAPENEHERRRFATEVNLAVESSFAQLPAADKTLLMQHYVDGLTTVELGRLYSVHRVSISRRMVRARRRLLEGARSQLVERLSLTTSECSSVIRLVRSQLDITLERVLA